MQTPLEFYLAPQDATRPGSAYLMPESAMDANSSDSSVSSIDSAGLRQALSSSTPPLVTDVRRDPTAIDTWGTTSPAAANVVVYCVHGHDVSQGAARTLAAFGMNAQFLEGGIEAWREAGGALASKTAGISTR